MIAYTNTCTKQTISFSSVDLDALQIVKPLLNNQPYTLKYYDTVLFTGSEDATENLLHKFELAVSAGFNKYGRREIISDSFDSLNY